MTPERDRAISVVDKVPEDAEVRRVLGRGFVDDLAEPVAEREPVGRLDRFAVLSKEAVTMRWPSGLNCALST